MIVRTSPGSIQLIAQPDHAHLARRVMEHCAPLATRPRRDAILHAIAEHDNGWTEQDAAPYLVPATKQIADFISAPVAARQMVWFIGVTRVSDDPWAAALVAQHAIVIYDRFRPDLEWGPFFTAMEEERDAWRGSSGLPLEELLSDYVFVRVADLISLSFCTVSTDELKFDRWAVRLSGTQVVVTPDPFDGKTIPVEITAREIPNQSFQSDEELRAAVRQARTVTLKGSVTGRH